MLVLFVTVWAAYVFFVHTFFGQLKVANPLVRSELPPLARATLEVVWHASSLVLAGITLAIGVRALRDSAFVFDAALVVVLTLALLFLWVGPTRIGSGFAAPQWMLLGPLAVCMAGMRFELPYAAPTLLGAIALVHFAWAAGFSWPAPSRHAAPAYVIGWREGAGMPSVLACMTVGVVLVALAAALVYDVGWVRWLCVSVFAARGVYGLVERWLRPTIKGTPYLRLSLAFYSPLCLLIAGLTLAHA